MPTAPVTPLTSTRTGAFRLNRVFVQLMLEHRDRLYRFVLRRVGNPSDAEELTQQTFVEAAFAYAGFRGDATVSTWLHGIALNLVRQHLARSPQCRYRFEDDETLAELPGGQPSPEQQLSLNQQMQLLAAGLADLPPAMREVLLLVALDELSYEDAARQLELPVGTVRSRVSRARAQLRERLAPAIH